MDQGIPRSTDQAVLLKILRSIAYEQAALGSLAAAEVKKITGLIRQIEQQGLYSLGKERHEFEKYFGAMLQAAVHMHIVLQSKAQTIAAHLGMTYSPLLPHELQGERQLVSCGQGTVVEQQSPFFGGKAILHSAHIEMSGEIVTAGDIRYSGCHGVVRQTLTALPGTLQIDWPSVNPYSELPGNPGKMTVRGRATIKKRMKPGKARCDDGTFTLTIWDYGSACCNHKFRMLITADKHLSLHHDSGIVDFTGIVKQKHISP